MYYIFLWLNFFFPSCQIHIKNYVLMFYFYLNKYVAYTSRFVEFFSLLTANVPYFQRTIQMSEFSAYPYGSSSQLIRIIRVLLYLKILKLPVLLMKRRQVAENQASVSHCYVKSRVYFLCLRCEAKTFCLLVTPWLHNEHQINTNLMCIGPCIILIT